MDTRVNKEEVIFYLTGGGDNQVSNRAVQASKSNKYRADKRHKHAADCVKATAKAVRDSDLAKSITSRQD